MCQNEDCCLLLRISGSKGERIGVYVDEPSQLIAITPQAWRQSPGKSMRDSFDNVPVNDASGPAMRDATRSGKYCT